MPSHDHPNPPPVDPHVLDMLAELQQPGEPDLLRELVTLFLRDTSTRLALLEQSLNAGDRDAAARAAHAIRGGAGSIGAAALHEHAGTTEHCVRGLDRQSALRAVEVLRAEFVRVREYLELLLSSRPH